MTNTAPKQTDREIRAELVAQEFRRACRSGCVLQFSAHVVPLILETCRISLEASKHVYKAGDGQSLLLDRALSELETLHARGGLSLARIRAGDLFRSPLSWPTTAAVAFVLFSQVANGGAIRGDAASWVIACEVNNLAGFFDRDFPNMAEQLRETLDPSTYVPVPEHLRPEPQPRKGSA